MKLHLFGASGSGVTTLGQALANRLSLPYFDSDDYFWLPSDPPYTQRRNPEERNRLIIADLSLQAGWILGGSIVHWGENLFPQFDLVVFLYVPPAIRMERLRRREMERYGEVIERDPKRKQQFDKFMAWAADYDNDTGIANRTLQVHKKWLPGLSCEVLEITGDTTTQERELLIINKLNGILPF